MNFAVFLMLRKVGIIVDLILVGVFECSHWEIMDGD